MRNGIERAICEELECLMLLFECVSVGSSEGGFPSEDREGALVVKWNGREHPEAKRADAGDGGMDFFKWGGELDGMCARADVHPEVKDGISEGGGGKLRYVFGEVAEEFALSFRCGTEDLCFESVDVEVASMRDDEENCEGGAEGENEVARGDADIVTVGADDSIVRGDLEGNEADDRI